VLASLLPGDWRLIDPRSLDLLFWGLRQAMIHYRRLSVEAAPSAACWLMLAAAR